MLLYFSYIRHVPDDLETNHLYWHTQNLILTVRSWQGDINDGKFPSLSSRCNRQTRRNKRRQVLVLPTNHGLRRAREEYYFHPRVMRRPTCVYPSIAIPASQRPASNSHLYLFFQDSTRLSLSLHLSAEACCFPPSIATGPANLPGPARRWYRTHAITKVSMRSNDARDERRASTSP